MTPFWEPSISIPVGRRREGWAEIDSIDPGPDHPYLGQPLSRRQLMMTTIFIALGIITLMGRTIELQIIQGEHYRSLAEGNRLRIQTIVGPRGLFYDQYGRVLTENVPR